MPQPFRSILGVVVGFMALIAIGTIGSFFCIQLFGKQVVHPGNAYLVAIAVSLAVAGLAGGWLVAYIAGSRPMVHGAVLAVLVFLATLPSWIHPSHFNGQSLAYRIFTTLLSPLAVLSGAATERAKS